MGATEKHTGTRVKWKMILVTVMLLLRSHTRDTAEVSGRSICVIVLLLWSAPLASSSNFLVNGNFVKRFQNSGLNKFVNGYVVLSIGKRNVSSYLTLTLISVLIFFASR